MSEAWDLTAGEGDAEPSEYPMTRMEIRRAREKKEGHRFFRAVMLILVTLVFLGGVAAGGVLAWQRYFELTPQKYYTHVESSVKSVNAELRSVQSLVRLVSQNEVPTALQVLQASATEKSLTTLSKKIGTFPAPKSRSTARTDLIRGSREYAEALGTIAAVGGNNVLVDIGTLNADVHKANADWHAGTRKIGIASPSLTVSGP